MRAPRITTLLFGLVSLTALLSACASTGAKRFWTEFSPSYSNFERHFDERGADIDAIEGIWVYLSPPWPRSDSSFVIVRDTIFEGYDYVGVLFEGTTDRSNISLRREYDHARPRGVIFMALRRATGDPSVYEYTDAAVLRGETCRDTPCHGIYVLTAEGELYRQRFAHEVYAPGHAWVRRHPRP